MGMKRQQRRCGYPPCRCGQVTPQVLCHSSRNFKIGKDISSIYYEVNYRKSLMKHVAASPSPLIPFNLLWAQHDFRKVKSLTSESAQQPSESASQPSPTPVEALPRLSQSAALSGRHHSDIYIS
jgi:hypothetical protein